MKEIDQIWAEVLSVAYMGAGGPNMIFRGVSDETFELIPSIGRSTSENTERDIEVLESHILEEFKRLTVPILKNFPSHDFEWLFLAQHYGVPTRLLDWSSNPLVALFFAVEQENGKDGAFYYLQHMVTDQYNLIDYRTANYTADARQAPASLFAIQPSQGEIVFVRPRYTDERYVNQKSILSNVKDPFVPLNVPGLKKIIIPSSLKYELRERLRILGISTSYIYPGLLGVAAEIKSHIFDPIISGRIKSIALRCSVDFDQ